MTVEVSHMTYYYYMATRYMYTPYSSIYDCRQAMVTFDARQTDFNNKPGMSNGFKNFKMVMSNGLNIYILAILTSYSWCNACLNILCSTTVTTVKVQSGKIMCNANTLHCQYSDLLKVQWS